MIQRPWEYCSLTNAVNARTSLASASGRTLNLTQSSPMGCYRVTVKRGLLLPPKDKVQQRGRLESQYTTKRRHAGPVRYSDLFDQAHSATHQDSLVSGSPSSSIRAPINSRNLAGVAHARHVFPEQRTIRPPCSMTSSQGVPHMTPAL
jgi:hypothetical protein